MSCIMSYSGEREMLKRLFGIQTYNALKIRLYSDDRTPSVSDEASYFTEISEGGYSAISINPSHWTIATTSNVTTATLSTQTFSFTSAITRISGYYITDSDGGELLFAERFSDGPYENYNEGTLTLDIVITIGS